VISEISAGFSYELCLSEGQSVLTAYISATDFKFPRNVSSCIPFPYTRLLTQFDLPQFTSENIALSCFNRQIILAAACTTYRYVVMKDVVMEDVAERVESIES